MSRTDIINHIIKKYGCENYLEIGVRDTDENFNLINSKNKDGVDPSPLKPVNYKMTSDEFFKTHAKEKMYDVIFIDGMHTAEQVYIDVKNSIKHLNPNGFIVLHDCNPPTKFHTRSVEEYYKKRGEWNGTVYKGFIKLKQELTDWKCFVVDEDFGCGVITQNNVSDVNQPMKDIPEEIGWSYFNENRINLLDLKTYNDFKNILNEY